MTVTTRNARAWRAAVWAVLALAVQPPAFAQPEKLSLVTAAVPPLVSSENYPGFLNRLTTTLFRRLNTEVSISSVPAERALINASTGLDDADIFRAAAIEETYPDLIRVSEPIFVNEFFAYSLRADIHIRNWDDLKPYAVAYPSGWKIYDLNVKNVTSVTLTPTIHELFPLLEKGRVDVILLDRWGARWALLQMHKDLKPVGHPMARVDMFIFLNKKHAGLSPKISQALRDMKADGSYKQIYDETLTPLESR